MQSSVTSAAAAAVMAVVVAWNSLPDFIRDPTSSTECML